MTIRDLLNKISKEKPNSFSEAELISFVNEVEAEVAEELHMDAEDVPVYVFKHDADLDKTLLVHAPYDRLYISYVKAMIDYTNEEYDSYANNQAQHIQDYRDFVDWVVRTGQAVKTNTVTRFKNILY